MISIKKETPMPTTLRAHEVSEGHWYNVDTHQTDETIVCYVDYINGEHVFVFFDEDEETPSCYTAGHISHRTFTLIDSVPDIMIRVPK